uniref:Homeobox domain-containing protein n=1 Tax=Magallana gigas TaxID=29159 RepID=A0A8W8IKR1_MAGGI
MTVTHSRFTQQAKDINTNTAQIEVKIILTKVKVWFQNRRTKYKRVKAEEDMTMAPSKNRSHVIRDQVTKKSDCRYDSSSEESDIDV